MEGIAEKVDRLASEFYVDTDCIMPGKDMPPELGATTPEEEETRHKVWKAWNKGYARGLEFEGGSLKQGGKNEMFLS